MLSVLKDEWNPPRYFLYGKSLFYLGSSSLTHFLNTVFPHKDIQLYPSWVYYRVYSNNDSYTGYRARVCEMHGKEHQEEVRRFYVEDDTEEYWCKLQAIERSPGFISWLIQSEKEECFLF